MTATAAPVGPSTSPQQDYDAAQSCAALGNNSSSVCDLQTQATPSELALLYRCVYIAGECSSLTHGFGVQHLFK